MRTCVVEQSHEQAAMALAPPFHYEGCVASVDQAGALWIIREAQESRPQETVCIYSPGSWARVTYEEEPK